MIGAFIFAMLLASTFANRLSGQTAAGRAAAPPLTLEQVWELNATYTDPSHGVSFRYPSVWQPETQFGYHPPVLTGSDDIPPIAGFGYVGSGFPRDRAAGPYSATNLEGFGIVYSARPATSTAGCESEAASLAIKSPSSTIKLDGRSFSVRETGEGGMSQSMYGKLYATYAAGTCYLFETNVAEVSIAAVEDVSELTPAQSDEIDSHLLEIIRTVRISAQ